MKRTVLTLAAAFMLISCTSSRPDFSEQLGWWEDARYGMFVHFGISSVKGMEISWPRDDFGPARYDSLAFRFNPHNFDADQWIDAAEKAGMKYIVLTTRHHDGFCLWDTKTTEHNIMNTPYGKDILRQLADAAHKRGMRLGWYYSVREWDDDNCSNPDPAKAQLYIDKMKAQLKEILTNYGKIDLLWFDYDGYPCPTDPQTIFDYVRGLDPDIIINNRLYPLDPNESSCYTGTCGMYATPEQVAGCYGEIPWETCSTSSSSRQWSIKYNDPPRPAAELIWETLESAGGNGNMLMNVGPDSTGIILPSYVDRLTEVGDWFRAHEGILYGTHCGPWKPTEDYISTAKGTDAYLVLKKGAAITLPYSRSIKVKAAGIDGEAIEFTTARDSIHFTIPDKYLGEPNVAVRLELAKEVRTPLAAFNTSGSLAYDKPAKASSSLSEVYMHCPSSAFDNTLECWFPGRKPSAGNGYGTLIRFNTEDAGRDFADSGWLEVDLGKKKEVSSYMVMMYGTENIGSLRLEYKSHGEWIVADTVSKPQGDWEGMIKPRKARHWRLVAEDCLFEWGIEEFQLFD